MERLTDCADSKSPKQNIQDHLKPHQKGNQSKSDQKGGSALSDKKFRNDLLIKVAGGILLGSVYSLFFFRGRTFPIAMGFGFGTGMAIKNQDIYAKKN